MLPAPRWVTPGEDHPHLCIFLPPEKQKSHQDKQEKLMTHRQTFRRKQPAKSRDNKEHGKLETLHNTRVLRNSVTLAF